jgi:hypothetical protein
MLQGCYKGGARVLQGYYKGASPYLDSVEMRVIKAGVRQVVTHPTQ